MAKIRATSALGHSSPVMRRKHQKQRDRSGGVQQHIRQMMSPAAFRPNSWQSSMCDSIASGYHSPPGPLVNAQAMLLPVRPART